MKNEFVTYKQALALKELGFDDYAFNWYSTNKHPSLIAGIFLTINSSEPLYSSEMHKIGIWKIKAPLKQQVFRWFREKYGWYANLSSWIHEEELGIYHEFEIYGNPNGVYGDGKYDTYEEAENACIDKLIEILKQQDNG